MTDPKDASFDQTFYRTVFVVQQAHLELLQVGFSFIDMEGYSSLKIGPICITDLTANLSYHLIIQDTP